MTEPEVLVNGEPVPVTSGNTAVSRTYAPGDHAACDAQIARLRARCAERDRLIDALLAEHPVELGRFCQIAQAAADPGGTYPLAADPAPPETGGQQS
jgi:hypothetical protein